MTSKILRALDANFNRSREGLRVCEDIARFFMDSPSLSEDLKKARHAISRSWKTFPANWVKLLEARNVQTDVGKKPSSLESRRKNMVDIFLANIERSKEALRALEEFSKAIDNTSWRQWKRIRFDIYDIEKRALPGLEALCDHKLGSSQPGSSGRRGDSRGSRRRSVSR